MKKMQLPQRKVLPNGLTVVVETVPHFPSVTAGVWVKTGSRCETTVMQGASHFVEHLVFKGTPSRTYSEIYRAFDRMGGVLDAFTSREIMGFYFRTQKTHFCEAFEVLSDVLCRPSFPADEVERERSVILEEIKMVNDTPSDLAGDLFLQAAFPGHPLGHPIQGTAETVSRMGRPALLRHYHRLLQPQNLIVTATGDCTLNEILNEVAPTFGKMPAGKAIPAKAPCFRAGREVFTRNHLEQAQLMLAFGADKSDSPRRFILLVLANLLGGTMSSRLFTEIREKRGLVYSISADHAGYQDGGLFGIQAASSHSSARATLNETVKVLGEIKHDLVSDDELDVARENLLGGTILSLESPSSRMGRLARNELYFGRQRSVEESIEGIRRVSAKHLRDASRDLFRPENLLVGVLGQKGALKGLDLSPLEAVK